MEKKVTERKGKNKGGKQLLGTLISMGFGAIIGVICVWVVGEEKMDGIGFFPFLLVFFGIFMICIAWGFVHVVLHEAGHLVGGLLSGYKYGFFRVGRFTLAKYEDGFKLKVFSIPGTGGQCGMIPPAYNNGNFPYKLYLLSGFTVNFITAAILFVVFLLLGADSIAGRICALGGAVAFYLGALNSIPLKAEIPNDGCQLFQLGKDERERRAMWESLDYMAKILQGIRSSEIQRDRGEKNVDELLAQCEGAKGMGEFSLYCDYIFDCGRYHEAEDMVTRLLDQGISITLYRQVYESEALFLELFLHGREERIKELATKEVLGFLKATSGTILSSTRTLYAYEMLYHKDEKSIAKLKKQIAKGMKNYPLLGELKQTEELVEQIEAMAGEQQA